MERTERLEALRKKLDQHDLAAFLVPRADEHQLEYPPANAERLAWVSGFTGSAGLGIIGRRKAAIFVDGRYTLQAEKQVDGSQWQQCHLLNDPPEEWLGAELAKGDRVGYDPRLHTPRGLQRIQAAVKGAEAQLFAVESNLIDDIWSDRPDAPRSKVELYPEALSGASWSSKLERISGALRREGLDALVISDPHNLAWLLNIRGGDVPATPIALGYGVLRSNGSFLLFLDALKLDDEVRGAIGSDGRVRFADPSSLGTELEELSGLKVRVDEQTGGDWIVRRLRGCGATVDLGADPCGLAKACKTDAELDAIRSAHVRDGVAIVRFLKWLRDNAPGNETEWTAARVLAGFRAEGENYRGPSFNTISAFGPNAAHCHYSLQEKTALPFREDQILLVDSGGQYLDGTTDITRTMILGTPTEEMKRRYTQVLKGHLSLGAARFPEGTTGSQLDVLARQYLWSDGVDFDHGTGHGVGCFLSVHEGPHAISKFPNPTALRPGMVVSNEPGYYKTGAFGIRIENLVAVTIVDPQPANAEVLTLGFETLSLAPYEPALIDVSLLDDRERALVNAYHERVRETLPPYLDASDAEFLAAVTAPIGT